MADLARLIRAGRTRARLSQAQLAARAKTSQSAIARYESDTARPTLATLERILAACGEAVALDVTQVREHPARQSRLALVRHGRRQLLEAARHRGVRNVRVFGSTARGQDNLGSDIDLLVELEPGRTLLDLIGFQQDAEDILGVSVDASTPRLLKRRVRSRAMREARVV